MRVQRTLSADMTGGSNLYWQYAQTLNGVSCPIHPEPVCVYMNKQSAYKTDVNSY